ncbi:protochlorophyllide-dependent translocon component 52, chloroplastic [Lolium perenne]|uniref:protochlorophyllide-dependent translocon component 52, chloroplastic n=1 Tax=Lolium perenne TaxID=4522 RepID=UPI003A99ACEB
MNPLALLLVPRACPSLPLHTSAPVPNSTRAARLAPAPAPAPARGQQAARLSFSVSAMVAPPSPRGGDEVERFNWMDQWYPFAPVCDLDPGAPHGKTVLGLRVVAWHDRAVNQWRVFDDTCPHRLAPLSEGRIDHKGRLQCVYHGWCFDGSGSCQFIPQAPALGPPVHKNNKACVASYPSVVQNNILWFYPRADAEHRDVLQRKRPPFIPEIDDPSFATMFTIRDLSYGYDVLLENFMDPVHVPYAHKVLLGKPAATALGPDMGMVGKLHNKEDPGRVEFDTEGGGPIRMKIEEANVDGFLSPQDNGGYYRYAAPCTFYGSPLPWDAQGEDKKRKKPHFMHVFICIPVAPGRSRVITAFPRNFGLWLDNIIPRWFHHIGQNAILDSDTYILHIEERNFAAAGLENWHRAVYLPTSSDTMVIAFRRWFREHCKNQIGWPATTVDQLPATPTKDKLMDRYWSHVAQCRACSAALKAMKALEVALQLAAVAVVGFLAVDKGTLVTSAAHKTAAVSLSVFCFAASRCLASFIHSNFYFQDYVHAYK